MVVWYNVTGIASNATDIVSFNQSINSELMGGYFGVLILMLIFVISLMAFLFSTNEINKSLVATSFVTFGASLFLFAMQLIPGLALFLSIVLLAGSIALGLRK